MEEGTGIVDDPAMPKVVEKNDGAETRIGGLRGWLKTDKKFAGTGSFQVNATIRQCPPDKVRAVEAL